MKIDFTTSMPIYLQIIEEFKRQIAIGNLVPGTKLPSQRDLALQLKVNANTVQRAYREMETLGLTETLRGQGTFVRDNISLVQELKTEMLTELIDEFIQSMQALGYEEDAILTMIKKRYSQLDTTNGGERTE